ncbi:hypothetical protein ACIHFC_01455 [Streptomyces sp. NPDC052013]|uniref:hypothetical protein n=1 Tax=unclassified Streptomyces TaxID=2593676 RepID=UPI00344DD20C
MTDTGHPAVLPLVPGVVDGVVAAVTDTDGSVALQIRIKFPGAGHDRSDRIEVVLEPEHREALTQVLLAAARPAGAPVHHLPLIPCSVGVGA